MPQNEHTEEYRDDDLDQDNDYNEQEPENDVEDTDDGSDVEHETDTDNDDEGDEDTVESLREKLQSETERREKAEKAIEKNKNREKENRSTKSNSDAVTREDLDTILLEARGYTDIEDQDVFRKYAKAEGKDVREAMQDPTVKAIVEQNQKQRKQRNATPSSSKRSGGQTKGVDYWVRQMNEHGKSAPNAEMRQKVRKRLAGK